MTQEKHSSGKLSLNIRKMKFMQRCLTEEERKELEDSKKVITNEHWELDIPSLGETNQQYEIIKSLLFCQSLRYGRLSFGGYNKKIEKLMAALEKTQNGNDDDYIEPADVSNVEMAEHYLSLEGTIAKRFNKLKSNKRSLTNDESTESKVRRTQCDERGFLKPEDN